MTAAASSEPSDGRGACPQASSPARSAGISRADTQSVSDTSTIAMELLSAAARSGQARQWRSLTADHVRAALAAPQVARTPHFVLHHLPESTVPASARGPSVVVGELPTEVAPRMAVSVDKLSRNKSMRGLWLGMVVPKRHARRSVTRQMIKRQVREAVRLRSMPSGAWLVRLRSGFDAQRFHSANSTPLRDAVRTELQDLFQRGLQRVAGPGAMAP